MQPLVRVIIPIYKLHPSKGEAISLAQCCKILGNYPITFIKPHSLDPHFYISSSTQAKFNIESFDDEFFKNKCGYNRLMLSEEFYSRFLNTKYILIYQLDAFVFKDELELWCKKGYDYIGAPWLDYIKKSFFKRIKFSLISKKHYRSNRKQPGSILPTDMQFYKRVGNGGFSLRHVEKFYTICKEKKKMVEYYNAHSDHHYFNEDVFWSLEVNRKDKVLKIPDYKTALHFSFEQKPGYAFGITKGKLPFGCHAWDVFSEFWTPLIRKEGYEV